ncbi:PTS ascorbate-specific transporter subunit IIA, partial [Vibrio cholerae]|nr:PTS ascorbate-specific transporter subunit IIA [Vibrio cholerae]
GVDLDKLRRCRDKQQVYAVIDQALSQQASAQQELAHIA